MMGFIFVIPAKIRVYVVEWTVPSDNIVDSGFLLLVWIHEMESVAIKTDLWQRFAKH